MALAWSFSLQPFLLPFLPWVGNQLDPSQVFPLGRGKNDHRQYLYSPVHRVLLHLASCLPPPTPFKAGLVTNVKCSKARIYQACLGTLHNPALDVLSATCWALAVKFWSWVSPPSPDPSWDTQCDRAAEHWASVQSLEKIAPGCWLQLAQGPRG